jgi:hypothetical protein
MLLRVAKSGKIQGIEECAESFPGRSAIKGSGIYVPSRTLRTADWPCNRVVMAASSAALTLPAAAKAVVEKLNLEAHPEGGYYKRFGDHNRASGFNFRS